MLKCCMLQENGVDLLFHTNTETGKTDELAADPQVNMGFIRSSTVSLRRVWLGEIHMTPAYMYMHRASGLPSRVRPQS